MNADAGSPKPKPHSEKLLVLRSFQRKEQEQVWLLRSQTKGQQMKLFKKLFYDAKKLRQIKKKVDNQTKLRYNKSINKKSSSGPSAPTPLIMNSKSVLLILFYLNFTLPEQSIWFFRKINMT